MKILEPVIGDFQDDVSSILNTNLNTPVRGALKFGNLLALIREHKGFLQKTLAKEAGMNVSVICEIENNRREVSLKSLKKIAKVLDIPYQVLLLYTLDPTKMSEDKQDAFSKIVKLINNDFL